MLTELEKTIKRQFTSTNRLFSICYECGPKLPIGSGVVPHYEVIPTVEQYINKENVSLKYILEQLENQK